MAAASRSLEREAHIGQLIGSHGMTLPQLSAALPMPPFYRVIEVQGFATVYNANYQPGEGLAQCVWPDRSWPQSFAGFSEGSYTHRYRAQPLSLAASWGQRRQ